MTQSTVAPQLLVATSLLTVPALALTVASAPLRDVVRQGVSLVGQVSSASVPVAEPVRALEASESKPHAVTETERSSSDSLSARATRSPGVGSDDPPPHPTDHAEPEPDPERGWMGMQVVELDPNAPRCDDIYVYIVTDWVDGGAMATLAVGTRARGYPKRIGARVGDYQLIGIGPATFGQGPAVWLANEEEVCRAMLFDDNPVRAKAKAKPKRKPKRRKRKRRK